MKVAILLSVWCIGALLCGCSHHEETTIGREIFMERDSTERVAHQQKLGLDIDSVTIQNIFETYKFYKSKPGELKLTRFYREGPYEIPEYVGRLVFESLDALYISKTSVVVESREYYDEFYTSQESWPYKIEIYTNGKCIDATLESDRQKEVCFDTFSPCTTVLIRVLDNLRNSAQLYLQCEDILDEYAMPKE